MSTTLTQNLTSDFLLARVNELESEVERMEELLRSAHAIAARKGKNTAWDRFAASIQEMGIGSVTARVYKVLPSDQEAAETVRG